MGPSRRRSHPGRHVLGEVQDAAGRPSGTGIQYDAPTTAVGPAPHRRGSPLRCHAHESSCSSPAVDAPSPGGHQNFPCGQRCGRSRAGIPPRAASSGSCTDGVGRHGRGTRTWSHLHGRVVNVFVRGERLDARDGRWTESPDRSRYRTRKRLNGKSSNQGATPRPRR